MNNLAADAGGGIAIEGRSSFVGTRVTATGNKTPGEGGGIYLESERLGILHDPLVTNNEAGIKDPLDVMTIGNPGEKGYVPGSNTAGGGGMYTEGGPVEIYGGEFSGNIATEEGGGISLDNFGAARIERTLIQGNKAGADGGGIENSGMRVTFDRIRVKGNSATIDGGGIYNSSSGDFLVIDSTIERNTATNGGGFANAPDADLIIRQSTILANTARFPGFDDAQQQLEGGEGGGFWSKADGDALLENNTITGNFAAVRGGGLYHDADGKLHLVNLTITRNSAPIGGGIGVVESDFAPEVPPKANESVVLRNTIIAESIRGGSCDWYVTSEGGNLSDAGVKTPPTTFSDTPPPPPVASCFTTPPPGSDASHMEGLRDRQGDPNLDAIADNGGATLTHRVTVDSLAVNQGVFPCPEVDQRGVARPQWEKCDVGAFEYDGSEEPPFDDVPPDSEYVSGPIPDTLETVAFRFTGSDNKTPVDELQYECRLVEHDPTEQVEIIAPWEPTPPELQWVTCSNPYVVPPAEESMFTFEVRAIDREGNIDPTPDVHAFSGEDTIAPQTIIVEKPGVVPPGGGTPVSYSRTGTFSFTATDNMTPAQFMEYECRIDTRDPDLWLECFNPAIFSNLTTGLHTVEVRATDLGEMVDPTPARYTWMVGEPQNCDSANITLTATADGMINEKDSWENYVFLTDLTVASEGIGDPTRVPPEPVIGENSRALFRFNLPNDAPNCELQSAQLQLWNESPNEGRSLDATLLDGDGHFLESTLTWDNQPAVVGQPVTIGVTTDTPRYLKWNVKDHVNGAIDNEQGTIGWRISDHLESDPEGDDQTFTSREAPIDPPEMTLPRLLLIYNTDGVPPPDGPLMDEGTEPTEIECGTVIQVDTILGNDLEDCFGEGIVIGKPNIVLDLNGHTVDGPDYLLGNITGQEEGFPAGIRNAGHTNVLITSSKPGAMVKEFGYGVLLGGTTHNVVENLTIQQNAMAGVELNDADDGRHGNTIRNNVIRDNELGVNIINDSYGSLIENNKIYGSLGEAIYIEFSNSHTVRGNEIVGVPFNPMLDSDGGFLLHSSSDNVIVGNVLRDTGDAGLVITQGSDNNRVGGPCVAGDGVAAGEGEGNKMWNNGDAGVYIQDSEHNKVCNNIAHQESDGGIVINSAHGTQMIGNDLRFNPNGIETADSNDILVEDNDASDSQADGFAIGNGINIIVRNNVANRTGGVGIGLEGATFDVNGLPIGTAIVQGNTTNENLAEGIEIADGAGHLIADNSAFNNQGHGIVAEGNVDGGGNVASGNGAVRPDAGNPPEPPDPTFPQCLGVVCDDPNAPPWSGSDLTAPNASITVGPVGPAPVPLLPNQLLPTANTSATFEFTGFDPPNSDGSLGYPESALVFECRLDPPPDIIEPVEPPEPEPGPPDPGPGDTQDQDPYLGEGWGHCISPVHFHNLEAGTHRFEVMVRDQADPEPNLDLTPVVYHWEINLSAPGEFDGPDSKAPDTFIVRAPDAATIATSATFRFQGSDNQTPGLSLTYQCRRYYNASSSITVIPDGVPPGQLGAWGPCAAPMEYPPDPNDPGLAEGYHRFEVRSIDMKGNADASPAVHNWQILTPPSDTTAPQTTIRTGPDPVIDPHLGDVHVLQGRPAGDVRVRALQARRGPGRVRRVHDAADPHQPGGRSAQAARPRSRPVGGARGAGRRDAGRVPLDGRRAACRAERLLRPGDHPEHDRPERPRRLSLRRPRHRRGRHHDRPRRPHHRRQGHRRRHPERRLRQRHHPERDDHRVRLRRHAQPGHDRQHRRGADGPQDGGGRSRARQPAARRPGAAAAPAADLELRLERRRQHHPVQRPPGQRHRRVAHEPRAGQRGPRQPLRGEQQERHLGRARERHADGQQRDHLHGRRRHRARGRRLERREQQLPGGQQRRRHPRRAHHERRSRQRRPALEQQRDREQQPDRERRRRDRGRGHQQSSSSAGPRSSTTSRSTRTATASRSTTRATRSSRTTTSAATRAASASSTPPTAASRGTPPTSPTATASAPSRSR